MIKKINEEDYYIALNSNADSKTLDKLSKSEDSLIRTLVAGNKNTGEATLINLAKDKEAYVRMCVAGNENCPVSILEKLSEDIENAVRRNVAENEKTPAKILSKLASDKSNYVRERVASNPNTPIEDLKKLLFDEIYYTQLLAGENKALQENSKVYLTSENFEDKNLIRELSKVANVLSKEDDKPFIWAKEVYRLDLSKKQIESTKGMENLIYLMDLKLSGSSIKNIDFLESCPYIRTLYLDGVEELNDFSVLSKLRNLEELSIDKENIGLIPDLSNIKELKIFDIFENQVNVKRLRFEEIKEFLNHYNDYKKMKEFKDNDRLNLDDKLKLAKNKILENRKDLNDFRKVQKIKR